MYVCDDIFALVPSENKAVLRLSSVILCCTTHPLSLLHKPTLNFCPCKTCYQWQLLLATCAKGLRGVSWRTEEYGIFRNIPESDFGSVRWNYWPHQKGSNDATTHGTVLHVWDSSSSPLHYRVTITFWYIWYLLLRRVCPPLSVFWKIQCILSSLKY